ncbi:protein of unknown function [Bradyrhizobium vignae]|uniref:Uncharacterized protein n=1 Tax=Bradyrhizobium vignae TaxID=1549949 RepID=A0A2U3Q7C8_9BRAD|nr:protein of unknown function [Bradyrhizobium vignae]
MGRAAAIAYAREGAHVGINYLLAEGPDAQEVIALIRRTGRTGGADARGRNSGTFFIYGLYKIVMEDISPADRWRS